MKVGPHFIGRAINNRKVASFDLIGQKEVTNVQSSRTLTCALATINLEENGTFIVLEQYILLDIKALVFHEELGPQNHHGRVVKGTGDGLLAEFASAVDAVECAVEIQRAMPAREEGIPTDRRIEYRIGINVGDIVVEGGDIYGDGVNAAARIEALTDPGGVFISGSAFNQVKNKVQLGFEDLGLHTVKNIEEPVHVCRVLLDPEAAGELPGQGRYRHPVRELFKRRVPQITGVYLGVSWAFLEFVDWAVSQYGLSPTVSSFVVSILLLFLPSVVWIAWRHGAPGRDRWGLTDGLIISANLAVAAGVLLSSADSRSVN